MANDEEQNQPQHTFKEMKGTIISPILSLLTKSCALSSKNIDKLNSACALSCETLAHK
jgi:hypothetical protein